MFEVLPVFLREGAEAVIGSMILASDRKQLRGVIWGFALGVVASIAIGIPLHHYVAEAEEKWEPVSAGVSTAVAFMLLGLAAYHLLRKKHLPAGVGFIGAFLLVLREGVEFTIFSLDSTPAKIAASVIVGSLILAVGVAILGRQLMRYMTLMNLAMVVFGFWLLWRTGEAMEEASYPEHLHIALVGVYLVLAAVVAVWSNQKELSNKST